MKLGLDRAVLQSMNAGSATVHLLSVCRELDITETVFCFYSNLR